MYRNMFKDIKKYIVQAEEKDKEYEVFGASSHKYKLNPVATIEEVEAFEEQYGLKLPESYAYFLTHIGNGGAGPHYGLYSLKDLERMNKEYFNQEPDEEMYIDENLTPEIWKELMDDEDMTDDEYEDMMKKVMSGVLNIGSQGCTFITILMCKGSEAGKIVYFDLNYEGLNPPYLTSMTFEEWYVGFFKDITMGYSTSGYGYYFVGSEEELLERLKHETSIDRKIKCLRGFIRLQKLSDKTIDYIFNISENELDSTRLQVLLECAVDSGVELYEKLINGENPVAAANCSRSLPEDIKYKYYDTVIDLLYEYDNGIDMDLIYYATDAPQRSAKDFMKILSNNKIPNYKKKTVLWAMATCPDVEEYMEYFISALKEGDYHIVDGILQGIEQAKLKSPKLSETYELLIEKFKDYPSIKHRIERIN